MIAIVPDADEQVVARILAGEQELFEVLIRRYNQRLYRVIRSLLRRDESEIEDVMQQAYVNAFTHLDQFEGRASFATWLTKIAVYEALARARRDGRFVSLDQHTAGDDLETTMAPLRADGVDPERGAFAGELRVLLEEAIERLPEAYRPVFVMREIEGLSTAETAECLGIRPDAVKTRLHRAKSALRDDLFEQAGMRSAEAFTFHARRCDRIVAAVMRRLGVTV